MSIIEKIEYLCAEKGESVHAMAREIGASPSAITKWRNGAVPRRNTLKAISDHFCVSIDWLLSDEETTPTKWDSKKGTSEYGTLSSQEKQIIDMYRELTEMGKMRLIQAVLNVHDKETNR